MKYPLEVEVGKTVTQLYWALQNHLNRLVEEYDLTIEHARLLLLISFNEGCTQQYIVEETFKSKPAVTTLLDAMTAKNLVVRIPDQTDRRNKLLYLTDKGKKLKEKVFSLIIEDISDILSDIDKAKLVEALNTLKQITKKLR
ncbi:MAG: MarR family transcriptional regulator [Balneolales bacterium]|nr:MarR family transcriptional regulator [Balneolales bacterium]